MKPDKLRLSLATSSPSVASGMSELWLSHYRLTNSELCGATATGFSRKL